MPRAVRPALLPVLVLAAAGCGEVPFLGASDPSVAAAADAQARALQAATARTKLLIAADLVSRLAVAAECPPGPAPVGAFVIADADYHGEVCIQGGDPTYDVVWRLAGGETYFGTGVRVRDRLVIGFGRDDREYGFAAYELADGTGVGTWASAGATALGEEDVAGLGMDADGVFPVRGVNPDGTSYDGELEVRPQGDTVALTWRIGPETYRGIGFIDDGVLGVGWGADSDVGVVSYVIDGERLVGTWAELEGARVGTETLVPR